MQTHFQIRWTKETRFIPIFLLLHRRFAISGWREGWMQPSTRAEWIAELVDVVNSFQIELNWRSVCFVAVDQTRETQDAAKPIPIFQKRENFIYAAGISIWFERRRIETECSVNSVAFVSRFFCSMMFVVRAQWSCTSFTANCYFVGRHNLASACVFVFVFAIAFHGIWDCSTGSCGIRI